jgi:microcystin-dependent protein
LAEIRIVAFNFAPRNWAFCDGQILPINQNQSLYSLLGTTYGGDGRTTFALPDLRGRTPIHFDGSHPLGQKAGEEAHVLTHAEIPAHTHQLQVSNDAADNAIPDGAALARSTATDPNWAPPGTAVDMASQAIATVGNGQGHQNMQPFLALTFCIALQGLFPSRN